MDSEEIIRILKSKTNPKNVEGMARFGINKKGTLGVPIPELRKLARKIGKNHKLAAEIFGSGIHEARILAGYIAEPGLMTEKEMENWVLKIDSWDDCDQICSSLFDKTKFAYKKTKQWSERKEEFVKRAAFSLMACLAVHDKKAPDTQFSDFFDIIKREAHDERNFVKKAVNWALRQAGKRNPRLNKEAIRVAKEIRRLAEKSGSKSAKWIADNALGELQSEFVGKRLEKGYNKE
jgi:3-methyladenine DNA glycosylase AlkD